MTADIRRTLPAVSHRGLTAPASPIRKLTPYAVAAAARGTHIFGLNIGQPDFATPEAARSAIADFDQPIISYAPSQGMRPTIAAWSSYFQKACNALVPEDNIVVTVGGSEAIMFAFMAVADPGDEILVFDPSYTNYCGFAAVAGINLLPLMRQPDSHYALPSNDVISSVLTEKTKAILLCNPDNPTGAVYSRSELERLLDIAESHNIFLIVDEVYRELVFDGLAPTSILHIPGAMSRCILVDSVSKRFNACGARIGCLTTSHPDILRAVLHFAQARLSAPTVEQLAMVPLLSDPLPYTLPLASQYESRRDAALDALSGIQGVTYSRPQGAFYIILQLPVENAEHFAQWMLESFVADGQTTMMAPLEGFYVTPGYGRQEVRLAFVLAEDKIRRAVGIIDKGLQMYRTTVGVSI